MASRIVSIPARFAPAAAPVSESLRPTRYAGPRPSTKTCGNVGQPLQSLIASRSFHFEK
jgi:hypothetical protein